jgi:ribonuclease HI
VLSEIQDSLEWSSVTTAVASIDVRTSLPGIGQSGIIAFTDGACIKNPGGPAGWCALLWASTDVQDGIVRQGAPALECYGHIPKSKTTTNNRAEIAAVLAVLSIAPPGLPLAIHSDSEYTIKVAQGTYQMKANPDLWAVYRKLLSFRKTPPTFVWVRGHAGHEYNERADELAGLGAWNHDQQAFNRWKISQTPEARSGLSSGEIATLRSSIQKLQAYCDLIDSKSGRISIQERKFIIDMAKRLQKNTFVPTEKQRNWIKVLVGKYHV